MRVIRLLFAVLLYASSVTLVVAEDSPYIATETIEKFHEALTTQDKAAVLALLASDVLIFESGGAEFTREGVRGAPSGRRHGVLSCDRSEDH